MSFRATLISATIGVFAIVAFGLAWFFFLGPDTPVGLGWYIFSFAAGLSMIVLPCTLPLAFVIVPLSMGKGAKGLGIALSFGLGVAITLSMYGVIAAVIGEVAIGTLGAPLEVVKNWLYFVAGALAFAFALGEIGLVKFRMPTYTGSAPAFIQKQQDYLKALLLGLFMGNIGVGCPHPATPVILTRIAASGDVFYGWLLFFVHATGRVLPLLLLAFLGILGINALKWLVARKDKIERATGWAMVFVAGFILVLGLFSHDWWVYSGQHTLLEEVTQEERFLGAIIDRFNFAGVPHAHGIPSGAGLFGLPLWLGNWVLVSLWILPMWWYYLMKKKEINSMAEGETKNIESRVSPWRFWLFLSISLLLILTFVRVLPDRFLRNATADMDEHMMDNQMDEMEKAMHGGMMNGGMMNDHDEHAADYHEEPDVVEGLVINLNIDPALPEIGLPAKLQFFVNEKPAATAVTDLELSQKKVMHVIGVRDDMNGFFHIHPQHTATPGIFEVDYTFLKPGVYKLWSEINRGGENHIFGHSTFTVGGAGVTSEKEISLGRNVIVDKYQISLEIAEPVEVGHEHLLSFDVHSLTGAEIDLEPYLGELMHITIIREDLTEFIHTHPMDKSMDGGMESHGTAPAIVNIAKAHVDEPAGVQSGAQTDDERVNIMATFPTPGFYKVFAQFRPEGIELLQEEALTASFWVKVVAEGSVPHTDDTGEVLTMGWWGKLFTSLVLMILLSWGINKYIQVKA
ncbi:MAG: hypothetical protein HYR95_01825 [Candidatus Colwellbacteria bacterium]|nr:hypothetical protein [Candidatus Colwellbacteria bacterium]